MGAFQRVEELSRHCGEGMRRLCPFPLRFADIQSRLGSSGYLNSSSSISRRTAGRRESAIRAVCSDTSRETGLDSDRASSRSILILPPRFFLDRRNPITTSFTLLSPQSTQLTILSIRRTSSPTKVTSSLFPSLPLDSSRISPAVSLARTTRNSTLDL